MTQICCSMHCDNTCFLFYPQYWYRWLTVPVRRFPAEQGRHGTGERGAEHDCRRAGPEGEDGGGRDDAAGGRLHAALRGHPRLPDHLRDHGAGWVPPRPPWPSSTTRPSPRSWSRVGTSPSSVAILDYQTISEIMEQGGYLPVLRGHPRLPDHLRDHGAGWVPPRPPWPSSTTRPSPRSWSRVGTSPSSVAILDYQTISEIMEQGGYLPVLRGHPRLPDHLRDHGAGWVPPRPPWPSSTTRPSPRSWSRVGTSPSSVAIPDYQTISEIMEQGGYLPALRGHPRLPDHLRDHGAGWVPPRPPWPSSTTRPSQRSWSRVGTSPPSVAILDYQTISEIMEQGGCSILRPPDVLRTGSSLPGARHRLIAAECAGRAAPAGYRRRADWK